MAHEFFINAMASGLSQLPNESIRDRQQASIDALWDVTTNRYNIEEQCDIGSKDYKEIEAWIGNVVGMTSRGMTNGDDFKSLYFRDITKDVKKGLYYRFDDNTWITYFTDRHGSLDVNIGVRRCNNVLRIVNPDNGAIFCIPCVVDYDMTSPSMQVTSSVLTPNNHATVMVQGNEETLRLFKLNTRYIIGGRPFKLLAYQNALIDKSISSETTLLYLELFLDELHSKDSIENQLADNGTYNYTIEINSNDMDLTEQSSGVLESIITLNDKEVKRKVVWESTNNGVVEIDENGNYKVHGQIGQSCDILVYLEGNENIMDSIKINIVADEKIVPKIIIDPAFNKMCQYESINFEVKMNCGPTICIPETSSVSLNKDNIVLDNKYLSIQKNENKYIITANSITKHDQILYIQAHSTDPNFDIACELPIKVVSMIG